ALTQAGGRALGFGYRGNETVGEWVADAVLRVDAIGGDRALPRCARREPGQVSAAKQRHIKNAVTRPKDQFIGNLVSQAHARTKIILVGIPRPSIVAVDETERALQIQTRDRNRTSCGEVEGAVTVVAVGCRLLQIISQAYVQREPAVHAPGILNINSVIM